MVKASIVSCVLHVVVLLIVISLTNVKPPKIANAGENIEVRMVSEDKGILTDPLKGNGLENREDTEQTKDETKEKSEKNAIVEKTIEVKKVPVKKIEKPKETEKKKIETPDKEQVELKDEASPELDEIKVVEAVKDEIKETSDKKSVKADSEISKETNKENSVNTEDETRGSEKGDIGEDLVKLSDGSYMAKHQGVKGLSFGFISSPEPNYPSLARRLGFKDEMIVKVIMEFNSNGRLEDMKFIGDEDRFGFRNEVEKTVNQWRLTSIKYNDTNVKMRFYKSFKFERLN